MLVLKGIIIGIGKIIPGVSGSLLAISMGLYPKMIDSINYFFDNKRDNFKFLFKIGIGVLISIVFFSNIIIYALNNYYLITMFFFIGLILGSMNDIKNNLDKKNNIIIYISFIVFILLGFINIDNNIFIGNSLLNFIYFVFSGFLDAFTMVVPGISGTATLMVIGAYNTLIECFSNIFNFNMILDNIKILFPFVLGIFIGVIITVKLISFLFKYYKSKTYSAIYGFSISTIFVIGIKCLKSSYSLIELIISIVFLILGLIITKKINHYVTCD